MRIPFASTCVTAFCDASLCQQTKTAAWALWIKGPHGTFCKSYIFKAKVATASEAEKAAVANTMRIFSRMYPAPAGMRLVIQTDCMAAVHWCNGVVSKDKRKVPPNAFEVELSRLATELRGAGVVLCVRHVKGHSGKDTPRSAVNDKIDRMARQLMRASRPKLPEGLNAALTASDMVKLLRTTS